MISVPAKMYHQWMTTWREIKDSGTLTGTGVAEVTGILATMECMFKQPAVANPPVAHAFAPAFAFGGSLPATQVHAESGEADDAKSKKSPPGFGCFLKEKKMKKDQDSLDAFRSLSQEERIKFVKQATEQNKARCQKRKKAEEPGDEVEKPDDEVKKPKQAGQLQVDEIDE
jgi:hypothetical protein